MKVSGEREEEGEPPLIPPPASLRYIDYICSREVMAPILHEIEKSLGIPIIFLEAPPDRSGPKAQQAGEVFSDNFADFGRI
jgi:hypothetical protein